MSREQRNSNRPHNSRSMIDNERTTPSAGQGSSGRPSAGQGNQYPFERPYGGPSRIDERPSAGQGSNRRSSGRGEYRTERRSGSAGWKSYAGR